MQLLKLYEHKKYLTKVSSLADLCQWEPILSRRRRRGVMFGGSTELPRSWGLMIKGAGGGGGGRDGGPVEGSASAEAKNKDTMRNSKQMIQAETTYFKIKF